MADQRGIALVIVLWMVTLLALMAASFLSETRTQALATQNRVAAAEAETAANAAVHWAIHQLLDGRQATNDSLPRTRRAVPVDGRPFRWRFQANGQGQPVDVTLRVRDETGKLDLNIVGTDILAGLFQQLGAERERARVLAARLADFRDSDDDPRPGGGEGRAYRQAGLPYGPKNSPFESVAEIAQVLGIDHRMVRRLRPHVTVVSGAPTVDPRVASAATLAALPGVKPDRARAYVEARRQAPATDPPTPPSGPAFAATPADSYAIVARAHGPDGAVFAREAVVEFQRRSRENPFTIRIWRQRMASGGA
ncbi:type II secretion system protein K (GspK) [Limimonas halophila]|uniref:Type II secretion system protein K (GspK) n=1 Tax=Limimonas halophila TaxID=1082479 RepID=A0A1G7NE35_9PROT|nr:type II secretion system protein GspK [Limimonas halophila]SDF72293.1 type II secretion system protein K (GspK) [Limimonas halophila]